MSETQNTPTTDRRGMIENRVRWMLADNYSDEQIYATTCRVFRITERNEREYVAAFILAGRTS